MSTPLTEILRSELRYIWSSIHGKSPIICAKSPAFMDCWNVLVILAACDLYLTDTESAQRSISSRNFQSYRKFQVANIIDKENAVLHHNSV